MFPVRRAASRRPWVAAGVAVALAGLAVTATPSVGSAAEGPERLLNGTFDSGTFAPWWLGANVTAGVDAGQWCVNVTGGSVNPWDLIVGQDQVPLELGKAYTYSFTATADPAISMTTTVQQNVDPFASAFAQRVALTPTAQAFSFDFSSSLGTPAGQVTFQLGANAPSSRVCLDNISLVGGEQSGGPVQDTGPAVRVNQVGYLTNLPKHASVVTDAATPQAWTLATAAGRVVAHGMTTLFGADAASGDTAQLIDFSRFSRAGTGYTLTVGDQTSHPFDISNSIYSTLPNDALEFYYQQRSGIPIEARFVGADHARPAGHLGVAPNQGDTLVPCLPGVCDYSLDVQGGWYDAGDQGKYVVNGGIAVWQLQNAYERSQLVPGADKRAFADGTQRIPEAHNRVPDILDEARWELAFLLEMQVPDGQPLAGMAHQKVHDENWTGLPTMPWLDNQPRFLHAPSTAATLNLAATAAQGARIWQRFDRRFAAQLRVAAEKAWAAAVAHPAIFASGADSTGGGAYDDTNVTDEFYWAAAELFTTTGKPAYRTALTSSPLYLAKSFTPGGFSWQSVGALGDLTLALVPNALPRSARAAVRTGIATAADGYLTAMHSQAYPVPFGASGYVWGSNSQVLNNALVLGAAADYTGRSTYRDGAVETLDYILGRNGLNQSYVTGYGDHATQNEHHRFWANQLDATLPHPPAGTIAGGPNSGLQDPVAARQLPGCAPQRCYVDDINSYSTNEEAINWNAPLVWVSQFAADAARPGHHW
ncbi:MAG: endoglucanase [Mycobacteriales bacterium]|jgi:endoglucanase